MQTKGSAVTSIHVVRPLSEQEDDLPSGWEVLDISSIPLGDLTRVDTIEARYAVDSHGYALHIHQLVELVRKLHTVIDSQNNVLRDQSTALAHRDTEIGRLKEQLIAILAGNDKK